jgi:hypothetical protein
VLDELIARLGALPDKQRREIEEAAAKATAGMKWLPNPGPQTEAYFHPADVLLYGGQGGGGKSDLGIGLSFTAHQRSLILRRKYANLGSLTERAIEINGSRSGFNGSPPPLLRTDDGRYIQFAGNQHLGDEQDWQGQPFDLKVFDEATQFLELQVRFHIGWIRSTVDGQRCRALLATNPPVDADGDWIIGMFRPWLDVTHANPAKHGELRWYVTAPDGSDMEVPGPEPIQLPGAAGPAIPMSRSFIPAALKDNPYLINTGYQAKLDGLPEPIRSAVRDGNFMAARADADFQVIPTQWIIDAQARWKPDGGRGLTMTACALDVGAGRDETVLAARHGSWFAELQCISGEAGRDESHSASLVLRHRKDNCPVVVDVGGGYGGPATLLMRENGIPFLRFNGAEPTQEETADGALKIYNKRAVAWWRMREALDPANDAKIALPPDTKLRADLAAPTWKLTTRGVLIEAKEDIKIRLGRSTDRGDAVVMAWSEGKRAASFAGVRNWQTAAPVSDPFDDF